MTTKPVTSNIRFFKKPYIRIYGGLHSVTSNIQIFDISWYRSTVLLDSPALQAVLALLDNSIDLIVDLFYDDAISGSTLALTLVLRSELIFVLSIFSNRLND